MCTEGRGAYAAIDAVGGETTKQLSLALRDGGTVYVYGALSGEPIQVDTLDTLYKYKRVEVQSHTPLLGVVDVQQGFVLTLHCPSCWILGRSDPVKASSSFIKLQSVLLQTVHLRLLIS